ncbi:MAG: NlpC/P60 family protein [Candidatus Sulfotelmatobacter sp.]
MRVRQEGIIFFSALSLVVAFLATAATAQKLEPTSVASSSTPKNLAGHGSAPALRMLTADEGLAVLSAALESRANPDSGSDCSHLVHAIYERAGFPYSYASSSSLYAGKAEFQRVARPQPGDLVVWPGHVGIAVDPAQRSFFSALRSGLGVEPYDSPYWKERGRPHFLRYVINAPPANRIASSIAESNLKTVASTDPAPSSRNASFDASLEASGKSPTHVGPARNVVSDATFHSQRPTPGEVTGALEQIFGETGEGLRGLDMLNPPKPLIVFDQLAVDRVHLRRDRGWAEVRITGALKLSKQKTNSTKHNEHQRWLLVHRNGDTWEITGPSEAIYIQSDVAVRALAHQLAALTDDPAGVPGTTGEKLQLSRLLSTFLEK